MKEIISKWYICDGCDRKTTINFSEKEEEKQVKCIYCGKYSIIRKSICKKNTK
jgi:DNA-directed RNA polymerase subunit RPC12/RpoP